MTVVYSSEVGLGAISDSGGWEGQKVCHSFAAQDAEEVISILNDMQADH